MKAAVYDRYGPPEVLGIREVPKPEAGAGEVLVRVVSTTVSAGDVRVRGFNIPRPVFWLPGRLVLGVFRPRKRILGTELSGVVEAVGPGVTRLAVGDEVFASPGFTKDGGGYAEYIALKADGPIVHKPAGMTFEEAACVPFGGLTALHFLQTLGKVQPNDRVLIVGASGAVGCASVQLAKHFGARVTGVCSGRNTELVASLGAERVIDYTAEDYTKADEPYDLIFDTVGATSFGRCKGILTDGGRFLTAVMGVREMLQMPWTKLFGRKRVLSGIAAESRELLEQLKAIIESGGYRSVIDRTYPLEEIVEAHRYVDTWRKRGNVVIKVSEPEQSGV